MQLGPMIRIPDRRPIVAISSCRAAPSGARLGKAGGHDHAATDAGLGALGDATDQLSRRHREDRDVNLIGRLTDRRGKRRDQTPRSAAD